MKILMLVASFLIAGCAVGDFPQFPSDVKDHYAIDIKGVPLSPMIKKYIINKDSLPENQTEAETGAMGDVSCLHFNIVSSNPYQIKYTGVVDIKLCNGVGGYKPDDSVKIYNWMQDAYNWAKGRQKCFIDPGNSGGG